MASPGKPHCASCVGTLSFRIFDIVVVAFTFGRWAGDELAVNG